MNVVDAAKKQVKNLAERVTDLAAEVAPTNESRVQAVTVARPRAEVIRLFQDAERLAEVVRDFAGLHSAGEGRMRWTFRGDEGPTWDCVVTVEDGTRVRYVDVNPNHSEEFYLDFRDAPQGRGTEVIARLSSPAPGALTGLLVYKTLYRARALLQTGEVPTLSATPAAR
ncbi:hypothetical protein ACQI4F_20115 [Mycolicibacterium vaccae]|uniref:hypothetical protein n=1 Tax=Mycolicibacterium vaccae TaxID=1810 RepID=UPI003CF066A2